MKGYFCLFICLHLLCPLIFGLRVERYQTGDVFPEYQLKLDCENDGYTWSQGKCRCSQDYKTFFISYDQSYGCLNLKAIQTDDCDMVKFANLPEEVIPFFTYEKDKSYYEYTNIAQSKHISNCLKNLKSFFVHEMNQTGTWNELKGVDIAYDHNKKNGGLVMFGDSLLMEKLQGTLLRVDFECRKRNTCFYAKFSGIRNYNVEVVLTYPPVTPSIIRTTTTTSKSITNSPSSTPFGYTFTITSTVSKVNNSSGFGQKMSDSSSSQGTSIGIGIACAIIAVIALAALFCIIYRRNRKTEAKKLPFGSESPQVNKDDEIYEDISAGQKPKEENNYAALDLSDITPDQYGSLNRPPILKPRTVSQLPVTSNKLRKNNQFIPAGITKTDQTNTPSKTTSVSQENQYEYLPNKDGKYSEPDSNTRPEENKYATPGDTNLYPMYFETMPET